MQRFFEISSHIVRCSYAPEGVGHDRPLLVQQENIVGKPVDACPLDVKSVAFHPRDIYRYVVKGKPHIKVIKTVDGQRTQIENLEKEWDRTAYRCEIELQFAPDECIFGLGQDEDGVYNKRGKVEYLYQHNMKIPMPMFVSSLGYGVFFDCACLMVFDDRGETTRITLECVEQVDFYVITGRMDEIIAGFRTLTGRASPLPLWAFGYMQSKERYKTQEELLAVAREYRRLGIPLDVVIQDWKTWEGELWGDKRVDKERYPALSQAMAELHEMQVHALVSIWPNMNSGGRDHREFADRGLLLNDYSTYNTFDPAARRLFWEQAERELYSGGFDGWWCDNTEPFTSPDWGSEDKLDEYTRYQLVGGEHEKYIDPSLANAFALVHAQGIYENQPQKPVVNLTRSGWAGIQKYGAILWAGDTAASWQELKREIAKGLNISMCGIPYWTVDAGAFFAGGSRCWRKWKGDPQAAPVWFWCGDYDQGIADKGYQELYTRWLQFACFLPIFRSHGTDTPREIWHFDEPFQSAIKKTIQLRYRLMPYIAEMARRVVDEHFTILRSLLFDFADDPKATDIDDQFMFGNDLLVVPITHPVLFQPNSKAIENPVTTKRCYLPQGTDWVDFRTGARHSGGKHIEVPVALDHIPVFVRAGVVIPMQEGLQYAEQERPVELLPFGAENASCPAPG